MPVPRGERDDGAATIGTTETPRRRRAVQRYTLAGAVVWSVMVAGSMAWNVFQNHEQTLALARKEALANFNKDQGFRLWGTSHGGIYVPITEKTPPSPYLAHVEERDITTPSGRKLTLMNPAYMVRQLMEDYNDLYGIRGHITGLELLRPENAPDPWEVAALKAFESGVEEVSEPATIDGDPYFRLIRPMVMEDGCMKCHGHLGYEVGDVRGGVGVAVPLQPYLETQRTADMVLAGSHGAIWLLGLGFIGFSGRRIRHQFDETARAEAAVRELNADLEHRVEARTADLVAAKDQAERANRAKSQFLASMSHELRTPLNGILGFAQLLEFNPSEPLSDQQREYVDLILSGGNHLLGLINDVLDLARIEAGALQLSVEPVCARTAVQECLSMVAPLADKWQVPVNSTLDCDGETAVMADAMRLRQVLVNLISNGIKYNRPGGTVLVSCQDGVFGPAAGPRAGEACVELAVSDTGKGIPADRLGELFQPFNRLGAEAGTVEGTGIGLAISRRLLDAMGATIAVDSVEGQGTTFRISLPLATECDKAELDRVRKSLDDAAISVLPGHHTVLYVEDNPNNLRLMSEILARFPNVTLLSASNAEQGIDLALERHPNVVILDINLPGMDGFEALRELQRHEATRHIPVLALSASAMPDDVKRGIKAGFQAYLTKPLDINKTLTAINVALTTPV